MDNQVLVSSFIYKQYHVLHKKIYRWDS